MSTGIRNVSGLQLGEHLACETKMTQLVVQCYRRNNQTQHSDGVQSRSLVDSSLTQLTTMKLTANCDCAKQSTVCLQTAPN